MALATGCAGHFSFSHHAKTRMSNAIFLEPSEHRTIKVTVKNSTDNQDIKLNGLLWQLQQKNYTLVGYNQGIQYDLQVHMIFCDEVSGGQVLDEILAAGFGSTAGLIAGATLAGSSGAGIIPLAAIGGGAAGSFVSSITEDTIQACVADVQIVESSSRNVEQTITTRAKFGDSSRQQVPGVLALATTDKAKTHSIEQMEREVVEVYKGKKRVHQTRIVVSDQKMWLDQEEAAPYLSKKLEMAIAGLF